MEDIFASDAGFDGKSTDELRRLLKSGNRSERARAMGAIARRAATNESLADEVVSLVQSPEARAQRFMGSVSLAHIGVACLAASGGEPIRAQLVPVVNEWPEPDKTDLLWFLRSQQVALADA